MALKKITKYRFDYHTKDHKISLMVNYKEKNKIPTVKIALSPQNAVFLMDMLRNERPIFWDDTRKVLHTGSEPTGEGEKKS